MEFTPKARSFRGFAAGLLSPFSAFSMIMRGKGMKRYLILPFFINAVILFSLVFISFYILFPLLFSFVPQGDAWYLALLRIIVKPVLILFLLYFIIIIYTFTGMIAAAPCIDPLSEKIELQILGIAAAPPFSISLALYEILRAFRSTLRLVLLMILFNIAILVFNIIPVIGTMLYTTAGFLSLLYFIGFQMFDVIMQRKGYVLGEKLRMMWSIRWAVLGTGLGVVIVSHIPVAGFLAPSFGAAGATKLFCENSAAGSMHGA